MNETDLADLLTRVVDDPSATLIAAIVLMCIVDVVKLAPPVKAWFAANPLRTRVSTGVLALSPGVITILLARKQWDRSATAALLCFFAATGLDKLKAWGKKDGAT